MLGSRPVVAFAAAIGAVTILVLAGWSGSLDSLQWLTTAATMNVNTALGFLLGATCLLGFAAPRVRGLVPWLAAAIIGLGALQLLQTFTGWDLGIDWALNSDLERSTEAPVSRPGRMSPVAAACFVSSGAALILCHWPTRRRVIVAQFLAVAVVLVGFNALTGHLSGLPELYRFAGGSSVAPHSAICFALMGAGIVVANRAYGAGMLLADRGDGGRQLRQLLPAVMLVPLLVHAAAISGYAWNWYDRSVANALLTTGNACILGAVAIWSSQRTFGLEAARVRLLLELAEREVQFRSTFENAFVGMGVVDRDGRWLLVNRRLCEMFQTTSGSLIGRPARATLPSRIIGALEDEAVPESRQAVRLTVGGEELSLDVGVTRLRPATDGDDHCLVTLHDVTELRRTAEQLRVRDRALASTITGVVITDERLPDRPIVYVNQAFSRITGHTPAEVLGRNCRFLNEGLQDQPALAELRAELAAGRPCVVQLRNRRKDGREFWNRLSVSPVHDARGEITHWVGVQEDISAEIAAVHEREVLLQQALSDRERAEKASRARDALLATVSHELRSPLNAMRLWASLLTKRPDSETAERAARQIEVNITAQSRLIGDLVDVSRIESGRLELERAGMDLVPLVSRVVESLRPTGEAKGIELRLELPATPAPVNVDAGRVEQVLRNLLDNAIKFTQPGGGVEVRVLLVGERAQVTVADSGKGMTEAQRAHAFDMFWQGDKEDTRSHGGLGLGLYLVRQIVERHGGAVTVHSDGPERGTRFAFTLPLIAAAAPGVPAPTFAVEGERIDAVADILVVDDEPSTVEGLAMALRFRGFPVRMANNADQALGLIRSKRPRVLLSDIMMPDKTGLDLIAAVRAEERLRGVDAPLRAIAMSGRGSPSDRRRMLRAGFDDYVQKPIDIDGLVTRIHLALVEPQVVRSDTNRILIVSGDAEQVRRIAEKLEHPDRLVFTAATALQAREVFREDPPDTVIIGLELPDGRGVDLARELLEDRQSLRVIGVGAIDGPERGVFDLVLHEPFDSESLTRGVEI